VTLNNKLRPEEPLTTFKQGNDRLQRSIIEVSIGQPRPGKTEGQRQKERGTLKGCEGRSSRKE
jgi:hypothetical protein